MKTGKLVLKGKIKLLSPAMVGSGSDERTDMDVILDSGGKPFIPATSFMGTLRHSIKLNDYKNKLDRFWGSENSDNPSRQYQSAIFCRDLTVCDSAEIVIRDGVKIDNKRGISAEGAKFDFEVIERDSILDLYMEIDLIKEYEEFFRQMLATIIKLLEDGKVKIGAKANSGFGMIILDSYNTYEFKFDRRDDVLKWLKQDFSMPVNLNIEPFLLKGKEFQINAQFTIKNSLIVRSYTADTNSPDAEHIKSKDKPVLPGTSLKGAIRARAEKILNTIGKPQDILKYLFGEVNETIKEACKGRITILESILPDYPSEIQTRIKIDRFTGGTIEGALLETMPLFSSKDEKLFNVTITISDYEDHEAGLLLLILKDLWTGDLPVGGEKAIGRGVLQGKSATIKWDSGSMTLEEKNLNELSKLQQFVDALVNFGGQHASK